MTFQSFSRVATVVVVSSALAGCGGGGWFGGNPETRQENIERQRQNTPVGQSEAQNRSTIWDLFSDRDNPNITVEVNKYIWQASLEVLNFLPIRSVDPFSGVIVTDFGTPPGGGQAYRATVYVQDPALEARSLKLSLNTRGGPVDAETTRAVEDAILTRARQLRIRDSKL
ncbi:uncharacterized protein DUF3576 [Rhodovulum bhavnagarense]|uniref:Uncharacterized protein DUF3576 n=1 Tax=Rhodovulum bhavnagarense TaxID=992286 RepID=A0A4R2RFZ3_9RHOB|nr:DUF3576 domain-containing protein [Rhodovulum bhavnagarense]TCP61614.1 uncharacterized protein DUF3576 [Rhodovulum bhavnagarense]